MPIGDDALSNMMSQGLQELQSANAGQLAPDAPPIQFAAPQAEAPAAEQNSYSAMLDQAASMSVDRGQDMGMGR